MDRDQGERRRSLATAVPRREVLPLILSLSKDDDDEIGTVRPARLHPGRESLGKQAESLRFMLRLLDKIQLGNVPVGGL